MPGCMTIRRLGLSHAVGLTEHEMDGLYAALLRSRTSELLGRLHTHDVAVLALGVVSAGDRRRDPARFKANADELLADLGVLEEDVALTRAVRELDEYGRSPSGPRRLVGSTLWVLHHRGAAVDERPLLTAAELSAEEGPLESSGLCGRESRVREHLYDFIREFVLLRRERGRVRVPDQTSADVVVEPRPRSRELVG